MEFLELVESIRREEASSSRIYAGEGRSARGRQRDPQYMAKLTEAAQLMAHASTGNRRAILHLEEALTTSDFPLMFGDILDRQLLANYMEIPAVWRNFVKVATVRDFRTVNRYAVDGAESTLSIVPEQAQYPESSLSESRFQYSVKKYGRRIPFSWEAIINDDLGALTDIPARFARAARRTEAKFATSLYVGTTGPDATFFASGHNNIVTSNPILSIAALQTAFTLLAAQRDADGEPIVIDAVELVVPPALEVTANNIINATQMFLTTNGGVGAVDASAEQRLQVNNWMSRRVRLSVDPYIPIVASSSNGNTSWFLFANPNQSRPAIEVGFLRGHETPEIFVKSANAQRVGGGTVDPLDGDFDTDSVQYKVRMCIGGTVLDYKAAIASNGSGS